MSSAGTTVGLFAGIAGIELGLSEAGFESELLCEIDPGALAVLRRHMPDSKLHDDVATLVDLPARTAVVSAGFPCQDLSQAGRGAGITGERSGLVGHVFRLLDSAEHAPTWVVLENVPFMLQLDRGEAMRLLTRELGSRGYRWAYRVVDARAFGVPQRRRRVLVIASRTEDPRPVLFGQDAGEPPLVEADVVAHGFYWTEGNRGLGWAVDAVPTIKGGSGFGIPSPPAIWMPDGDIVTPDVRDAERMQGFPTDWTEPAVTDAGLRIGSRWRLVGNAVCVAMARWLGKRLVEPEITEPWFLEVSLAGAKKWPSAAWGEGDAAYAVDVSEYPIRTPRPPLQDFLRYPAAPLSHRATVGFTSRLERSSLRYPADFLDDLKSHADRLLTNAVEVVGG